MSNVSRWRDSGHLERAVQAAGVQERFDAAVAAMLDDARGWRLAELRKRRGQLVPLQNVEAMLPGRAGTGRGIDPGVVQDLPDRGGRDRVAEPDQLALHPPVAPRGTRISASSDAWCRVSTVRQLSR